MRKGILVLIALITVFITISAVSAEGFDFSFGSQSDSKGGSINVENNKLTVQDEKFTIPSGFKENESARLLAQDSPDVNGAKVTFVKFENGDKNFTVKVIFGNYLKFNLSVSDGGENKTIGDFNGVYVPDDNNGVGFSYLANPDKLVQIHAPDEATLQSILKK